MRTTTPDHPYLARLQGLRFHPVFIVGPHRSGTTMLASLLAKTGRFNFTSVFHILNRDRLLALREQRAEAEARDELRRRFAKLGLATRGYDDVEVSPDTPEEYAYALEHQGRRPVLKPANLPSFLTFCRKAQLVQDPARPLLLKNPFDANHFLYAAEALPEAKFVFIFRDPVEIVSSQLNAIRYALENTCAYDVMVSERYRRLTSSRFLIRAARWAYSDRFPLLLAQVLSHVGGQGDYMARNFDALADRAVGVRYADLCREPRRELERVLDRLGQPSESVTEAATRAVRPRPKRLSPEAERAATRIRRRFQLYCRRFDV